ncbi:hypothetical protein Pcinc_032637 [Petrolisthes cinctipes]|uniref:Spindle and kinetochore-associated protein 3 n=1 Tax=Petrolisthes cinctipes TaxID=88211 RepID=A0AAE1K2P8_PETCI|nr:hypothetical protein Pcinc_032637 [Petrolisthes cinctipes]
MEQDSTTRGFFGQLKTLASQIDKDVSDLAFNLNQPAGEKPYLYDSTLKALKKDVQEVKTGSKEIGKQLLPTSKFSDDVKAMEELLNTKKKGIDKMEHYLTKFGYTPLPKPVENLPMMEADQQQMEEDCDRNVAGGVLHGTTVGHVYKQIRAGNRLQKPDGHPSYKIPLLISPEEPRLSEYSMQVPSSRSAKIPLLVTPEEPRLSEYSMQVLSSLRSAPEEQVHSYGAGHRNRNNSENKTLEEPCSPELSEASRSNCRGNKTLQEPCSPELSEASRSVLFLTTRARQPSHQGPSNTTHYNKPRRRRVGPSFAEVYRQSSAKPSPDQQQPREPTYPSSTTMENFLDIDAIPPSPQLSEVTQRIFGEWRK